MANKPKKNETKLNQLIKSWAQFAPTKSFGGMTLTEFKAKVKASLEARDTIANLEKQLGAELTNRDSSDVSSMFNANLVVNAIKGDPDHGEDSALYESLGYVRKSERKSGLKRAKKVTPTA